MKSLKTSIILARWEANVASGNYAGIETHSVILEPGEEDLLLFTSPLKALNIIASEAMESLASWS